VLGGKGFIGRHAVAALKDQNIDVVVGTRSPSKTKSAENERCYRLEELCAAEDWKGTVEEFDVILNCVGILRPVGKATYDRVHHLAPQAIATTCGDQVRFIQVSALGLNNANRSGFLTSKLEGEEAIKKTKGNWIIARPSLLDGEGGYGAKWLRGVARSPVFLAPTDAKGKIAALTASDLGEALCRLCLAPSEALLLNESRIFELGGTQTYDFESYIRALRLRYSSSRALAIPLPGILARIGAHIFDVFHITPFSFGHWELLRSNNVPIPNRLPELLGRPPMQVAPHPAN
jgi:uncharacterized protein YbjT (DUF2867 family)